MDLVGTRIANSPNRYQVKRGQPSGSVPTEPHTSSHTYTSTTGKSRLFHASLSSSNPCFIVNISRVLILHQRRHRSWLGLSSEPCAPTPPSLFTNRRHFVLLPLNERRVRVSDIAKSSLNQLKLKFFLKTIDNGNVVVTSHCVTTTLADISHYTRKILRKQHNQFSSPRAPPIIFLPPVYSPLMQGSRSRPGAVAVEQANRASTYGEHTIVSNTSSQLTNCNKRLKRRSAAVADCR